ncbi:methylated-DNA--[protein]-cysteine S-methyltransferase [Clostridium sp. Sa3CUN1]|uniref:Methylated-DNA--[protein]-cysteine S-methyltransferase n=1 Tax=Clostridium gallinarum TaxID=2762246 RepID=A0ABR8Q575_9CLOT|nr:methylated-DNA--[protein]-cysteine S-methyltransferase [Clostridium gallinarum]MBD7915567.1 methylated-DNA--[protein]-cysteine S-methyltransferase [Clostridium gallinarum]
MKNNDEKLYYYKISTIVGNIYIIKSHKGLRNIEIIEEDWDNFKDKYNLIEDEQMCKEEIKQIKEYFLGKRKSFDLILDIEDTDFRKKVWVELINIPYGEVRSYSDIAKAIGNEKAVRAIGQANKANPIPIVIPCHRVIGKNQKLIGYAGNHTDIQEKLINLEKSFLN